MFCLIGYMGAGKSYLSNYMADNSDWKVADLDNYIVEKEGATILEMMQNSEAYFRKLESAYLQEITTSDFDLVSLGGGTACSEENWKIIKKKYTSIYLKWSVDTLFERLKHDKADRPLIAHFSDEDLKEFIQKSLNEREAFYTRADIIFDGDHQTLEELTAILSNYAIRKG